MGKTRTRVPRVVFLSLGLYFLNASPVLPDQIILRSHEQFDFARTLMERGEYGHAVWEFKRFLHLFPEDPQVPKARYLIGICQLKDRRYEDARETFFQVLKLDPDSSVAVNALFLLGESYYQQGVLKEAEYYFGQILEGYPHLDMRNAALYRLGWTRMRENQWQEASEIFSKVEKESVFSANSLLLEKESLKGETLPYKSPTRAGVLAAVVPGLGHAYVSRYKDAAVAFLLNGLFIWAAVESFRQDLYVLGGILTFLEIGWYTGNIYSAVNVAHKHNRKLQSDFLGRLQDRLDLQLFTAKKGLVGLALNFQF